MKRYSYQRAVILDILKSTKSHPTAKWVYEQARKIIPNISLGTVYRNLSELSKSGEISCFSAKDEFEHFDFTAKPHSHFCCLECGEIIDLQLPEINICKNVENQLQCEVEKEEIMFYGRCKKCKAL